MPCSTKRRVNLVKVEGMDRRAKSSLQIALFTSAR